MGNNGLTVARLIDHGGIPALEINGKMVPALIFFFNTEEPPGGWEFVEPQVRLSAKAGVHIYSMPLHWPWYEEGVEPDFSIGEKMLDAIVSYDPEALFIPRMRCEGSPEWLETHPEARTVYANGTSPIMSSMASEVWWNALEKGYSRAISHYENSRFGNRMIAYHPVSQHTNEWFYHDYYLYGSDFSRANQEGFRRWLKVKYGTDAALQKAWEQTDVAFSNANIPPNQPIEPALLESSDQFFEIFQKLPENRDYVDFYEYANQLTAGRVIDICKIIKHETDNKKLTVLFYGYILELHGGDSGHFAMNRVLDAPEVNLLVSPISYHDRDRGGAGSFMTAIDSVSKHGKMWLVENDTRTHTYDTRGLPREWYEGMRISKDINETLGLITREFGSMLAHRCGTWWMDLMSRGWFSDPKVWELIKEKLKPLYDRLMEQPTPYVPDVAFIVDENSLLYLRYPATTLYDEVRYNPAYAGICKKQRLFLGKAGAAFGIYYLPDFINGKVPRCKLYWFANSFYTTDAQVEAIRARLEKEGATAVWQYAPGYMGPDGSSLKRAEKLMGICLKQGPGKLGSQGKGFMSGLTWGEPLGVNPRFSVEDDGAEVLAAYQNAPEASLVRKKTGNRENVFVGDLLLSHAMLTRLFEMMGIHTWTRDGGVIQTDGRWLFVHYKEPGEKIIYLPENCRVKEPTTHIEGYSGEVIRVEFKENETKIFELGTK